MRRPALAAAASLLLAACADRPDDVAPAYVSPSKFAPLACPQIAAELDRLGPEVARAEQAQNDVANRDALAVGAGALLFLPALLILADDDASADLARLKGDRAALDDAWLAKGCAAPAA